MDEVAAGGPGEGTGHAGETPTEPTNSKGDAAAGKLVWADNCAGCHGLAGNGGNGGPSLIDNPNAADPAKVRAQVTNGGGGMPSFKDTLSQQQINNVAAYVSQDIAKQK